MSRAAVVLSLDRGLAAALDAEAVRRGEDRLVVAFEIIAEHLPRAIAQLAGASFTAQVDHRRTDRGQS